jgi:hypothetical protein
MKKTWILVGGIVMLLIAAVLVVNREKQASPIVTTSRTDSHEHDDGPATPATPATPKAKVVPAYFEQAPSRSSLGPTLAPEKFTGLTRDAYRAVREIPVTIAQMPCYCHCDRSIGHKSLYSCFEDDHAAHCAVCVNEALMAHKLEKEGKLSAPQIRERIVEQFGHLND